MADILTRVFSSYTAKGGPVSHERGGLSSPWSGPVSHERGGLSSPWSGPVSHERGGLSSPWSGPVSHERGGLSSPWSGPVSHERGGLSSPWSVLLVGDRSTSRSVLLLAALSAASWGGMKVLFFTRTQIQTVPPSVQSCLPNLRPDSLKMIKFCYPQTLEELLLQVASLHEPANTSPTAPSLVIVDRLQSFLCGQGGGGFSHQGEQSSAAHLSALLHDTAAFLTEVLERRAPGSGPCRLLASFQPEPHPGPPHHPVLEVLDRYFAAHCTLDRTDGYAAPGLEGVWQVSLSGAGPGDPTGHTSQEWQLLVFTDGLMEFRSR